MADLNYRLTITIELDTDYKREAERHEREVIDLLTTTDAVPYSGMLSDLQLVDEYGDTYNG